MTTKEFPHVYHCREVEKAEVIGIYKQQQHGKVSHCYIVTVTCSDKSQITVYRTLRQIKSFQKDIARTLKVTGGNDDSKRDMKRVVQGLNNALRSGHETMGNFKMIESLNDFFSVSTRFKEMSQLQITRNFFEPSECDATATQWSKKGNTYIYVPRNTRNDKTSESVDKCEEPRRSIRLDSAGEETQDDSDSDSSGKSQSTTNSHAVSSVAAADYGKKLISNHKDEEDEAVQHNKSGRCLIGRSSQGCEPDKSSSGFVPTSHLTECTSDGSNNSFDAIDDNSHLFPAFARSTPALDDMFDLSQLEADLGAESLKFKKSSVSKARQELDHKISNGSSISSEINATCDRLGKSIKTTEFRFSKSSPFVRRRQPNARGNWELKSRHRNTVALLTSDTISRPANGSVANRDSEGRISNSTDNLFLSSSTRNIASEIGCDYICKESFKATSSDELSFTEGSVLKILRRNKNGWWLASYKGRTGIVPGVHLKRYDDPIRTLSLRMLNTI